jgi:hypothetical protein
MRKLLIIILSVAALNGCQSARMKSAAEKDTLYIFSTNVNGSGQEIEIELKKGKSFYYPLMAIWVEDLDGNYVQSLYVAESIAKGVFGHGDASTGKWMPGPIRRPAALPYWGHRRGVQAPDGYYIPTQSDPMPDAYTGATPTTGFLLTTRPNEELEKEVIIFMEINQSWDWNEYWTNNKFPDDEQYKTSAQPALVYSVKVNLNQPGEYDMKLVGHSHHSGKDGNLYADLSTFTTALNIVGRLTVRVK